LSQAELLYKNDFYRAAGAIGGVVLERYLKTLCEVNQIEVGGNDTIEPLATKIYKSGKIPEFDITLFKSIQHLASIRNKCDHPKEEPKQHEVRELLDKIKKITFLGL
jgi:HEPN domain-containing protein